MKKQSGFTLVEGLLIILILSVISFSGYYIWNQNQTTGTNQITANQTSENNPADNTEKSPSDPSDNSEHDWERFESGKKSFSIEIADGLDGIRDTSSDFFIFREYVTQDTPAKVTDVDGYGSDGFFALMIYADKTSNMYSSTDKLNENTESFTTGAGVKGTKTTYDDPYLPPCEGLGCYLGDKHTMYDFPVESTGETVRIWYARRVLNEETRVNYAIENDDPDYTKTIDEMVYTLKLN